MKGFDLLFAPATVLFSLLLIVYLAIYLEERSTVFKKLGAAASSILFALVLVNIGLLPPESVIYDFFSSSGVVAGIALILLGVNLSSLKEASAPMLKAFLVGAVGSALGGILMGLLLASSFGPDTWKLSGQFSATYIGGGMNFAAVGQALQTSSEIFTAGIAADVIVTAFWLIACIVVPNLLEKEISADSANKVESQSNMPEKLSLEQLLFSSGKAIKLLDLALLGAIVMGVIWLAEVLANVVPFIPMILWLTTIVLLVAQIKAIKEIPGTVVIGNYLILLFLATNGAQSVVAKIVEIGPSIFYFAVGTVIIHGLVIFGIGRLMKIDAKTIAIASQANVGGPTSAMALAGARGASGMILSGVVVGLLGYAIGNYIGLFIANMMKYFLL